MVFVYFLGAEPQGLNILSSTTVLFPQSYLYVLKEHKTY